MKKSGLITTLTAAVLCLASCTITVNSSATKKAVTTNNSDTNNNNDGGGSNTGSLLDTLKSKMIPIVTGIFEISESEVDYAEYEDDEATAYVYTYSSTNLTFVETAASLGESDAESAVGGVESLLPTNAQYDTTYSEEDDDYGYYDVWYKSGDYYYVIFAYDYYAMLAVDIFPSSQVSEYRTFMEYED